MFRILRLICFTLTAFTQFTANHTIATYAVKLKKTGTTIDSYVSLMMISVSLIAGSLLSTYLADILWQNILNIASLGGSAIGLFTVAIAPYLHKWK